MKLNAHPEYSIVKMSWRELRPYIKEFRSIIFKEKLRLAPFQLNGYSVDELNTRIENNNGEPFRINLGLFKGDEFVGWSFGWQIDCETFYMTNSAVFPEHRRQGLYNALLKEVVEMVVAEGLQFILSRHKATNIAVIVPKIRFGFYFSRIEDCKANGALIYLRYQCKPSA